MTAEDRTAPGTGQTFTPQGAPAASTGEQQTRYSATPPSVPSRASQSVPSAQSVQPQTGATPARSSFRPTTGQQPVGGQRPVSGQQPLSGAQPVSGQQQAFGGEQQGFGGQQAAPAWSPTTQPLTRPSGVEPVTDEQPTAPVRSAAESGGFSATVGAGFGKVKGYAVKAKDDLLSGDDMSATRREGGPRKARVLVSRVDPWSALKIGFLLSIALGIMTVVAVYVLWSVLNGMGTFSLADQWIQDLFTSNEELNLEQFYSLDKWMSAAVLISVVNVVLLTALSAVFAFLYNIVSSIVGGVYVTLTDD